MIRRRRRKWFFSDAGVGGGFGFEHGIGLEFMPSSMEGIGLWRAWCWGNE